MEILTASASRKDPRLRGHNELTRKESDDDEESCDSGNVHGGALRWRALDPTIADKRQCYGGLRRALHQNHGVPKALRYLLHCQRHHGRLPAGRSAASSGLAKIIRFGQGACFTADIPDRELRALSPLNDLSG
jgi:hypothetical protein